MTKRETLPDALNTRRVVLPSKIARIEILSYNTGKMAIEYLNGEKQWEVMDPGQIYAAAVLDSCNDVYLAVKLIVPEGIPDPTRGDCNTLMLFPTTLVVTIPDPASVDSRAAILYRDEINRDARTRGKFRYCQYTPAELRLREMVNF